MGTRLLEDVSCTLDGNGNGLIASPQATSWSKATVALQCTASTGAQFIVGIGKTNVQIGATPVITNKLGFSAGATLVAGPYLLAPNERLMVQIVAGNVGDQVSGSIFGVQSLDPTNVDADTVSGSVTSTTITAGSVNASIVGNVPVLNASGTQLAVAQSQVLCGSLSVAISGNGSATYSVPTGIHSIAVGANTGGPTTNPNSHITLDGVQSNIRYLNLNMANQFITNPQGTSNKLMLSPFLSSIDNQVTITVTGFGGAPATTFYVVAILDAEAVAEFLNAGGAPVPVMPTNDSGQETAWDIDITASINNRQGVSLQQSAAPPWLAAQSYAEINASVAGSGASVTLVSPAVNQYLYLFHITWGITTAFSGAGDYAVIFESGSSRHIVSLITELAGEKYYEGHGVKIGIVGVALKLANNATSTLSFHGGLSYTLATV